MDMKQSPLIDVRNITKQYKANRTSLTAVKDLSFSIFPGEILAFAGESGCGKSTVARLLMRLLEPSSGSIYFEGKDICKLTRHELFTMRRNIQMIFQNPSSSLNPKMTVEDILSEPFIIHQLFDKSERQRRICELLDKVNLDRSLLGRLPDELSGGQKQRVSIARALALNPRFIICDEPLSALDVSTQKQIVHLLKKLQAQENLTLLFISHDLAVIRHFAHRIAIMYLGEIVEVGLTEDIFNRPKHPYTQALLSSILIPDPMKESRRIQISLKGEIPSAFNVPTGCPFHTRCPMAMPMCVTHKPQWKEADGLHQVKCHLESSRFE